MKIKEGFEIKQIADSYAIIPTGEKVVDFSSVIMLNETSAFLWDCLSAGKNEEELVSAMLAEYNVDEQIAKADVKSFLEELNEAGVLEV